ncbi:MAG: RNA methyltransferase [Polyangiaceae bacterium]
MITQADLKRYRALQQKKFRGESRRYLVQGRKVVAELLESTTRVEVLLASEPAAEHIKPLAAAKRVPVQILASHELDKIGTFEKGNELIAIAVAPDPLPFRAPAGDELMLALDGVRDPRNLGSLVRIADWFGAGRLLMSHDCMELHNPKVVQSTMGSLFRVETRYANLAQELSACHAAGASIYIADMGGKSIFETEIKRPAVIVLGSESHGHSNATASIGAEVVAIPRFGKAESLNVAMAASALLTEASRQLVRARP